MSADRPAPPLGDDPRRIHIGHVPIDVVDFAGALDRVDDLVQSGAGGMVFTPNVDHIVVAETSSSLRRAYARASLSVVDGVPVLWASRLLGMPLPEKISGSDFVLPLMARAAQRGYRVYFVGGAAGAAERATEILRRTHPSLEIVGHDAARISVDDLVDGPDAEHQTNPIADAVAQRAAMARPNIVLVALGNPKQELWCSKHLDFLRPAVLVAVGAGLDFVAGMVRRAPRWMSRVGLEWVYRLAQEPRRLAGRYLLRDPAFVGIVARQLLSRRERRDAGATR